MSAEVKWSARQPVILGLLGMVVLVVGIGGWSVRTQIAGAVVASGTVQVETFRQVVQHQDGGTVAELSAREGARLAAGDVLIRFDDTVPRSERAIILGQLYEMQARQARLEAERDGSSIPKFPNALVDAAALDPSVNDFLNGQMRLFTARLNTLGEQIDQRRERSTQFENQIKGLRIQLDAVKEQIALVAEERIDQESLLAKGLTQASRVLTLKREEARLRGQIGELEASIAQSAGQIAEIRIELLSLESTRREEAITTLRDMSVRMVELQERLLALDETLSRLEVRAPMAGVIYGLTVHTLRAVVRPAESVMFIVPESSQLVVKARIPTVHIDQVRKGQSAALHFSAFDQRNTPVINGLVDKVSPDAFTDDTTGASYYSAEIIPNAAEIAALTNAELIPGMPVEVFLQTEPRTPLSYLLKPMEDFFKRALRES